MYRVLEQTCRELWRLANRELFKGQLRHEPRFRVWDADQHAGHFHVIYGRPVIEIHEAMFHEGHDLMVLETMVHEMVHQLQWERTLPIQHDEFFSETFKEIWGA